LGALQIRNYLGVPYAAGGQTTAAICRIRPSSRQAAGTPLYGLKPWDATTLLVGIAGLAAATILASWLPAHPATRVEPTVALRAE
jgi:ABC-type lipoprotein release transport system permease subunit